MRHTLRIGWLTTLLGAMVLGGERPATQSADDPPAAWKQQFGLDTMSAVDASAAGDPDVDGVNNATEYITGTHPRGFFNRYFAEGATGAFFDVSIDYAEEYIRDYADYADSSDHKSWDLI